MLDLYEPRQPKDDDPAEQVGPETLPQPLVGILTIHILQEGPNPSYLQGTPDTFPDTFPSPLKVDPPMPYRSPGPTYSECPQ